MHSFWVCIVARSSKLNEFYNKVLCFKHIPKVLKPIFLVSVDIFSINRILIPSCFKKLISIYFFIILLLLELISLSKMTKRDARVELKVRI